MRWQGRTGIGEQASFPGAHDCCLARPSPGIFQRVRCDRDSGPQPVVAGGDDGAAVRAGPGGLVTGGACETEHLEIAASTGLVKKARAVGMTEAAQLLQQNLQEEQKMLQQVEQIAQQLTQQIAAMGGSMNQGASASAI